MAYELPEEYQEYLRTNVSALERLGDLFSGIDERVDYVVTQLAQLGLAEETINRLTEAIEELKAIGFVMPIRTEQVVLSQTLQPLQGLKLEDNVPIDGKIVSVIFHYPDGCDALVNIAFGHGSEQICPSEGFITLNDATPSFPVSEPAKKGDVLWAVMENGDGSNPHAVSVIVTIVG